MSKPLQIKVPLTPSQIAPVSAWATRLNNSDFHQMDEVEVRGSGLYANAHDIADLIKIADERQSNEFDVFRLKAAAVRSLQDSIARRKNRASIRNLKVALDNIKKSMPGEWKNDKLTLDEPSYPLGYRMQVAP